MAFITEEKDDPCSKWMAATTKEFPQTGNVDYWNIVDSNVKQWAKEITVAQFWSETSRELEKWRTEYRAQTGSSLLSQAKIPDFVSKSVESSIEKLQRKYSEATIASAFTSGYPIPKIGDLVRVRLTCSYLDGVEFIADKLMDLAKLLGVKAVHEKQGKIEGYYAQHINITQDVLLKVAGATKAIQIDCEIQIATDMSTKMWDTSHGLYERTRGAPDEAQNWQWKHTDPRFISNQLGHMVHLVDGLLIQLRDNAKQRG